MFKKVLLYSFFAYALFGLVGVPLLLKPQLEQLVSQETNAKLSIDKIRFNPFLFKLKLFDVHLDSLDAKPLVNFKSLLFDIELYSLANKTVHIKEITLERPKLSVVYNEDKTLNLLNILKPTKKEQKAVPKEEITIPRVVVNSVAIDNGEVLYSDFTHKDVFKFSFHDLGFTLKDIDTKDFNRSDAKIKFYTELGDGGFFELNTEIKKMQPLILDGNVDFQASKLYSEWKYVKELLNIEVADGKVSFRANYHLNLDDLNATSIDDINIAIDKLRIIPKGGAGDILTLNKLLVEKTTVQPFKQDVHIQNLSLAGLQVHAKRDDKGELDWSKFAQVNLEESNETKQEVSQNSSSAWNVVVDDVALEKIGVVFEDSGIKPHVTSKLNSLNFYAKNLTLAGEKPFAYNLNLLLNDKFQCKSSGTLKHNILDIQSHIDCNGFDITHYKPYINQVAKSELRVYNLDLQSALLGFDANVSVKDINKSIAVTLNDTNLSLSDLALYKRYRRDKIVTFDALKVSGIHVNTLKKEATIDKTALNNLYLNTRRYKSGTLNLETLVAPKRASKKHTKSSKAKPFDVKLKHFSLDNARVNFYDYTLSPRVLSRLDRIYFNAYNIDLKKRTWLDYRLSARVNYKGRVKARGKLRHTPLRERGTFELRNIALKDVTPYLQESTFISVDSGKLSLKTKTSYAPSSKNPDIKLSGSAYLKDFSFSDTRDKTTLLAMNDLDLHAFTFELFPNRLFVDKIDLKSLYVDAMIDENRVMNFAKLMKSVENNETNTTQNLAKVEDTNSTVKENSEEKKESFPYKIMKINIADGNAKFADFSIPLKFATDIHDINGEILAISSSANEVSAIDISGDIDEYGSTKLKGSINSANPKQFTDLDFDFKNLELNSLSGYSASFAGYEIDSGKLYLSLGYKIKDSELLGKNKITIKKIKLGKEFEDENVTKLPLGFVIALLEDDDGVIDIDMPVEGNVDEPDFKYGALVWKTFGKLIIGAVTSPFKFLGSIMGIKGDTLEYAEFEMASNEILPTEREKLDNIADMMLKRPKIKLMLSPSYDKVQDKKALQRQKLIKLVLAKSGNENDENGKNSMTVDVLESIYKEYKDDDKLDKIASKLETKFEDEAFDRAYSEALVRLCTRIQKVTQKELEALAKSRTEVLTRYLVEKKGIKKERIIEGEMHVVPTNKENKLVKLNLKVEVE